MTTPVVVVHGGAGDVPAERHDAHVRGVARAAEAGLAALLRGETALDAVVAAVVTLENDPSFNAGTGACLTADGSMELDASIMSGQDLRAGAVCAMPPYTNPIRIARAVLEDGRHVLYAAHGADAFARAHGFTPSTREAMLTDAARLRWEQWRKGNASREWAGGTVGAVACDEHGHVAAGTSTGGTVGKLAGRVGDSPLIGCGTYADDTAGACSATGAGESIIRVALARIVTEAMTRGASAQDAAETAIATLGARGHGTGGIIVVGPDGAVGVAKNTTTMSHAIARAGEPVIARIAS